MDTKQNDYVCNKVTGSLKETASLSVLHPVRITEPKPECWETIFYLEKCSVHQLLSCYEDGRWTLNRVIIYMYETLLLDPSKKQLH